MSGSLASIDLNLLVALDALLREGQVSRAGEQIGLSQSAMSHALARLREHFDDPLLVRGRGGMERTALAEQLALGLPGLMSQIEATLVREAKVFDPVSSQREFFVGANDYAASVILPSLAARLAERAPGVRLRVRHLPPEPHRHALRDGELDLAVGWFRASEGLHDEELFRDDFRVLVRNDHPLVCKRLSLAAYVKLPHVLISSPGEGPGVVDHALAALGKQRTVALRVPHFLVAPMIVAKSDMLLTCASRVAELAMATLPVRAMRAPLELPSFPCLVVWDDKGACDPAVDWLRAQLRELAADLCTPVGLK